MNMKCIRYENRNEWLDLSYHMIQAQSHTTNEKAYRMTHPRTRTTCTCITMTL